MERTADCNRRHLLASAGIAECTDGRSSPNSSWKIVPDAVKIYRETLAIGRPDRLNTSSADSFSAAFFRPSHS
jgi:hypothetical protein